jgi:hypothetical protein
MGDSDGGSDGGNASGGLELSEGAIREHCKS